jgi:hypothetical protein
VIVRSLWVLVVFGGAARAADTQATLDALLTEVRELRMAVQRAAAVGPRLEIAMRRLDWQEQRVARVGERLTNVRNRLSAVTSTNAEMAARLRGAEAEMPQASGDRRKALEDVVSAIKGEMEQSTRLESQLRAEEAEAASDVRTEQAKADELAVKIENLERALTPPGR